MTVSSQTTSTTIASSGAGQTAFLFDFPLSNKDHVVVYLDGVLESTSLYLVNYVVGSDGGQIDYTVSPTTGSEIVISRNTPLTQDLGFPIAGPFPSRSHEGALDKLTMMILDLLDFTTDTVIAGDTVLQIQIDNIVPGNLPDGTVDNAVLRYDLTSGLWVEETSVKASSAGIDLSGNAVINYTIADAVVASASGVLTIDYAAAQSIYVALAENITSTVIDNLPATGLAVLEFEVLQDSTPRTWALPAGITWIGGTPPDITTADSLHLIRLRTRNGGTSYMGTFGEQFS